MNSFGLSLRVLFMCTCLSLLGLACGKDGGSEDDGTRATGSGGTTATGGGTTATGGGTTATGGGATATSGGATTATGGTSNGTGSATAGGTTATGSATTSGNTTSGGTGSNTGNTTSGGTGSTTGNTQGGGTSIGTTGGGVPSCDPSKNGTSQSTCKADETCWPMSTGGRCLKSTGKKKHDEVCSIQIVGTGNNASLTGSDCEVGAVCATDQGQTSGKCIKLCNHNDVTSCGKEDSCVPNDATKPVFGLCAGVPSCSVAAQDCATKHKTKFPDAAKVTCFPLRGTASGCYEITNTKASKAGEECKWAEKATLKESPCAGGLYCFLGSCTEFCGANSAPPACNVTERKTCFEIPDQQTGQSAYSWGLCGKSCKVKDQDCGDTATCTPTTLGAICSSAPKADSTATGVKKLGEACTDTDSCVAGTICLGGKCNKFCDPAKTDPCGAGSKDSCVRLLGSKGSVNDWGVCTTKCNPGKNSGCTTGSFCGIGGYKDDGFCQKSGGGTVDTDKTCVQPKDGEAADSVPADKRCKDGHYCLASSGGFGQQATTCIKLCSLSDSTTCSGQGPTGSVKSCKQTGVHTATNQLDWGLCY